MKCLNFWLVVFCCLIAPSSLSAQTPKQIRADLLKSFKKIDYWRNHRYDQDIENDLLVDSLKSANRNFAKKLKLYLEKYPAATAASSKSLARKYFYLDITTSSNNIFRIYSWDTWLGAQRNLYENVMECKSDTSYKVIIDSIKKFTYYAPNYHKIYTVTANGKTYYLAVYLYINDERDWDEGVRIYAIQNGDLIEVKMIKTDSGLKAGLSYKVHSYAVGRPKIHFKSKSSTIYLPLIDTNYRFTHKFALYKFTGQYFERVKN